MKHMRFTAVGLVILALAGCDAAPIDGVVAESTSRNVALDPTDVTVATRTPYTVRAFRVIVPEDLEVSEKNSYFPGADIVWRGDPLGDRHVQVKAIFEAGTQKGIDRIETEAKAVDVLIQVTRFHSVTERARYTVGGVHAMEFYMTLFDPKTQTKLERRFIKADLPAYAGSRALAADAKGITMKSRITEHLASVIRTELEFRGER